MESGTQPKKLRLWNGRGLRGTGDTFYVAATNRLAAAKLLAHATNKIHKIDREELRSWELSKWSKELQGDHYTESWGKDMKGITPEEGVWYSATDGSKPERII